MCSDSMVLENHILKSFLPENEQACSFVTNYLYGEGEHVGIFDLRTMEMTEGDLPSRAEAMVREWMTQNQEELLKMWDDQNIRKLPPL